MVQHITSCLSTSCAGKMVEHY